MESRDLISVSRPVFWSFGLGLEGFRSRSRDLCLKTLHRLFFMKFFKKKFLTKTALKNDCSKFSHSIRSVAKFSLLLCCLRYGENYLTSNYLTSTPFKIYTEFNKKCACTNEPAVRNLCNERLRAGLLR